jgi:hypothetical protein
MTAGFLENRQIPFSGFSFTYHDCVRRGKIAARRQIAHADVTLLDLPQPLLSILRDRFVAASRRRRSRHSRPRRIDLLGMIRSGSMAFIVPPLLGDHSIRPLDQGDEDCWITELGVPVREIRLDDTARSTAGAAGVDLDFLRDDFLERLG